ncbi:unnamed protein product [Caenorhabditis angaria]|uniref:NADP-dependent oxidoreductase domain-containing protein n=1 Tax=Caenorhabditis angaria TaxID=860376 RepID=A0A9P1N0P7_9PELO|nr:unnamed protein product [Caenorhabditis angaria]
MDPCTSFSLTLSNNLQIPRVGLGTTHSSGWYHDTVVHALTRGKYRMVDTAKRYGVEELLGQAIEDSKIDRSQLFLCTKLWPSDCGKAVREAARKSCAKLKSDYLDLYMIHMPQLPDWVSNQKECREETWRQMELLYEDDHVRSIGVSNYSQSDIEELGEFASIMPHVNQIEYHPWYHDRRLKEFCDDLGILTMAYCPLAKGRYLEDERLSAIAARHPGKSAAQICLRWNIQQGNAVVPKSTDFGRISENMQIFDFELSQEDMRVLDGMASKEFKVVDLSDISNKMNLPDGYKLKGRVFGLPARENEPTKNCKKEPEHNNLTQSAIF